MSRFDLKGWQGKLLRVDLTAGTCTDEVLNEKWAKELDIPYEKHVISAHRMPDQLAAFGKHAADQGFGVIIAGAGGAAHLP